MSRDCFRFSRLLLNPFGTSIPRSYFPWDIFSLTSSMQFCEVIISAWNPFRFENAAWDISVLSLSQTPILML